MYQRPFSICQPGKIVITEIKCISINQRRVFLTDTWFLCFCIIPKFCSLFSLSLFFTLKYILFYIKNFALSYSMDVVSSFWLSTSNHHIFTIFSAKYMFRKLKNLNRLVQKIFPKLNIQNGCQSWSLIVATKIVCITLSTIWKGWYCHKHTKTNTF